MTVAARLLDTGHYAAARIHAVTQRLEDNWSMFSRALQMRENVLALSVNFHARSNEVRWRMGWGDKHTFLQYISNVDDWLTTAQGGNGDISQCSAAELETIIQRHQQLMEDVTDKYTLVS
jgi:hypothetical protein